MLIVREHTLNTGEIQMDSCNYVVAANQPWEPIFNIWTCMRAKSLQSCPTPRYPMDCSPPAPAVHGILQVGIPEWIAVPSSPTSLMSPALAGRFFTTTVTWEVGRLDIKQLQIQLSDKRSRCYRIMKKKSN